MKTNELRLGNWVVYNNQIVKTTGLHYDMFECGNPDDENWMCTGRISEVQPIELTEEILVKIGFEKIFQSNITKGMFELNYDISDNEFINVICRLFEDGTLNLTIIERYGSMMGDNSLYKNGIKYLHQLQNAYYLLTNEELEVEL